MLDVRLPARAVPLASRGAYVPPLAVGARSCTTASPAPSRSQQFLVAQCSGIAAAACVFARRRRSGGAFVISFPPGGESINHKSIFVRASSHAGVAMAAGARDADATPKATFSFDENLRRRFVEIAEPYFLPGAEGEDAPSPLGFGSLVFGMLLGVSGATFFLALAALELVGSIPQLASLFPAPGAAAKLAELATPTYMGAAAVALGGAALVFGARREDLSGKWRQWGLLGLLIFLLLCVTGINVVVSYVFRSIDNVLVAKNEEGFYMQLQLFVAVLVVAVPVIASYRFVRLTLARSWREFLTLLILDRYFEERAYYLLDSNSEGATTIDNPDQRIAEDVDAFTSESLGFLLDVLGSVSNLVSFSAILWATSEQLTFALVAYAFIGTVVALAIGGELIGINYKQLQLQADFRYSLVHVRDNAEAIAFYQGEGREQDAVGAKLKAALRNYDRVIQWTTGLTIYQKIFFYVARLVPYFVVGGLYFSGKVDFGTLGQVTFAFSMVLSSVTLIVSRIQDISRFSAGVNRLGVFYEALTESGRQHATLGGGSHMAKDRIATLTSSTRDAAAAGSVELDGLTLWTPTGRTLVEDISFTLGVPGVEPTTASMQLPSRLLVVGSSGVGKSSILRAIAGLWTQGRGRIRRPDVSEMLFLPQKPYMPLGDLRTQLVYPSEVSSLDDAALVQVLAEFGLGDLPHRFKNGFDATLDWTRVLSLGEQQRLAAARCMISSPKVAVLDEATSALPVKDERNLYACLQDRHISYISVGHRPTLVEYHDLILELLGEGRWRVMSPREYNEASAMRAESSPMASTV